jgi:hypothetical protein
MGSLQKIFDLFSLINAAWNLESLSILFLNLVWHSWIFDIECRCRGARPGNLIPRGSQTLFSIMRRGIRPSGSDFSGYVATYNILPQSDVHSNEMRRLWEAACTGAQCPSNLSVPYSG